MRHEYIVEVDDTDRFYSFAFAGQIRGTCKQLVRCRECMHNGLEDTDCPMHGWGKSDTDFCSWAERREE
jgi:hypothetical protein